MPQVSYRIFSLGWGGGGRGVGGGTSLWQGGLNENPDDDKYGSSEACSSPRLLPEAIPFEGCSSVSLTTKALRKKVTNQNLPIGSNGDTNIRGTLLNLNYIGLLRHSCSISMAF